MNQLLPSSVLIAGLLQGCSQNNAPTLPQLSTGWHNTEYIGRDVLHCWKVPISTQGYQTLIQQLQMESISAEQQHSSASANCSQLQWDINFPNQAQHSWQSSQGSLRRLMAYKDDYLYLVSEVR